MSEFEDPAQPFPTEGAAAPESGGGRFAAGMGAGADGDRLRGVLARLEGLVDWERRDRAPGAGRAMRVDLEPIRALLGRLGDPQRRFRCVHVAGSKGKGSVAALIAMGLRKAGAGPVGVYGSPHVERIHERIRVDGEPIGDAALAGALEVVLDVRERALGEPPNPIYEATWFDVLTAAALVHFRDAEVAWVVAECGLGGRLDSTNALSGEVCLLTNVYLEHTAILGDTEAAIAAEKVGILDPGRPLVTGLDPDSAAGQVVAARALELGSVVHWCPPEGGETIEERNVRLAQVALEVLGSEIEGPPEGVFGALLGPEEVLAARLPGRLERFECERALGGQVPIVLDGAHVGASLEAVLADLALQPGLGAPPVVVLGLGRDKDVEGLLKVLCGRVDSVICTSVGEGPVVRPEELMAQALRLELEATAVASPRPALSRALELVPADGWVLVTGSLHLIGAVRGALGNRTAPCSRSSPTSS